MAKLAKARDCNEYLKVILRSGVRLTPGRFPHISAAFMAKLVRHLTSNEEIVSSNLAEGNFFGCF